MKQAAWKKLLSVGFIERMPTAEENKLCGPTSWEEWPQWAKQVERTVPALLTRAALIELAEWRRQDEKIHANYVDERDRAEKRGKYAPLIVVDQEWARPPGAGGTATLKQKEYLRQLGVRDQEPLLESISKAEASQLITDVFKLRDTL